MREFVLGNVAGLRLSVQARAFVILPILWGLFTLAAVRQIRVTVRAAGGLAMAAVLGHLLLALWHHLGHAVAARATGYPMVGISSWGVLATSVYPTDEPPLSAKVHIRRALGGPAASGLLTLIQWGIIRVARPARATTRWLLWLLFLDNLLVNTAQVLVPLRINDGQTLRQWIPELYRTTPS